MRTISIATILLLAACSAPEDSGLTEPADTDPADTTKPTTFPVVEPQVVTVDTRDGVTLEADLYVGQAGSPGFVLLHMTPSGGWDRTSWPREFIDQLTTRGWSVLALDRRGAGGSGGVAEDAYIGELGRYDVEAAVGALGEVSALAIVGASNGTTSMVDYAVWAPSEGLLPPAALGYMTGGTYTETQNAMSAVPLVPSVFTFSTEERAWSVAQEGLDDGTWAFEEYTGGDHGTLMFEAKPKVADHLVAFFTSVL